MCRQHSNGWSPTQGAARIYHYQQTQAVYRFVLSNLRFEWICFEKKWNFDLVDPEQAK